MSIPTPSARETFLASSALTPLAPTHFHTTTSNCPICTESDNPDSDPRIISTPCHHVFHRACLVTWLVSLGPRNGTCPSCRRVLYRTRQGDGRERPTRGIFVPRSLPIDRVPRPLAQIEGEPHLASRMWGLMIKFFAANGGNLEELDVQAKGKGGAVDRESGGGGEESEGGGGEA